MSCDTSTVNSTSIASAITIHQNMAPGASSQAILGAASSAAMNSTPTLTSNTISSTTVLNKQRLQELVHEVDPNEQLDDDVEELLLQIADDFIENVVRASCLLAKHRQSHALEVKDVQLALEKNWNMWIPGFGSDELRPYKKSAITDAHKQRINIIRKQKK